MKCPIDGTNLTITVREGVEIDYCPQCRGVWLDRGELDKLIERSNSVGVRDSYRRDYDDDDDRRYSPQYKKKKGWLGDILDF